MSSLQKLISLLHKTFFSHLNEKVALLPVPQKKTFTPASFAVGRAGAIVGYKGMVIRLCGEVHSRTMGMRGCFIGTYTMDRSDYPELPSMVSVCPPSREDIS